MIPGKQAINSSVRNHTTARDHTFQQAWQLMALPQNGVENRGGGCFDFTGCPPACCRGWNTTSEQVSATAETPPQSPSPEGHKLLIFQHPSWDAQGCAAHTPSMHTAVNTQTPAESAPGEGTKLCNRHRDPSGSTSPSQFPYLQGGIIFLLWEHVHYRHGCQKRQRQSRFSLNFPLSVITKVSSRNWIRNKEHLSAVLSVQFHK